MVRGLIQLAQGGAQRLAQPLHHALDTRDVVVGRANEGKQAFGGVLAQHPHTCGLDRTLWIPWEFPPQLKILYRLSNMHHSSVIFRRSGYGSRFDPQLSTGVVSSAHVHVHINHGTLNCARTTLGERKLNQIAALGRDS